MTTASPSLPARHRHEVWLGVLLCLLWLAVALPSDASPYLLLASAGALLLWQPLWRADTRPPARTLLALAALSALLLLPGHWPALLWLTFIAALMAGQLVPRGKLSLGHAAALALVLLLWGLHALPATLNVRLPVALTWLSGGGLLLCLGLLAVTTPAAPGELRARGLLESAGVWLLLVILSLLSVTLMHATGWPYPAALATAFAGTGAALLGAAALLGGAVSGGLHNLFALHLLEQGIPLDEWLAWLLEQQAAQDSPQALLEAAQARLLASPWYVGARWRLDERSGGSGDMTGESWSVRQGPLLLELWPSTAGAGLRVQSLHLLQVLALLHHFTSARQQHTAQARLKAAHETGARLTHDMKNLLQSLQGLMALTQVPPVEAAPLLAAHLPQVYERLARTLDKLQSGGSHLDQTLIPAAQWWAELRGRYAARGVDFHGQPEIARGVVRGAMDSVTGVLLENALEKRGTADAHVRAAWFEDASGQGVRVCDSGPAVPPEVAAQLFRLPVESAKGLGLGLYQAARTAYRIGYELTLESNTPGQVCFVLRSRAATGAARTP